MAKIDTISEKMMYSTLRLFDPIKESSATGFIYVFEVNGISMHALITNRHFAEGVNNLNQLDFSKKEIHQRIVTKVHLDNDEILDLDINVLWYLHSKEDLAFLNLNEIYNYVKTNTGKNMFFSSIVEKNIPTEEQLDNLSAIEDVVMVGYPNGLFDEEHNLPIFRKGITSSHPAVDHNGRRHGLVDMACLPGSSGSPIFIMNEGSYGNKKGGIVLGSRLYFIGIQNAMPVRTSLSIFKKSIDPVTKKITYNSTDDYAVNDDINLGMYIKASELMEFKSLIAAANPPRE